MQISTIQTQTLLSFCPNFLLEWARLFSLRTGTCYLHTGETNAPLESSSFLFLNPFQQQIERDAKNLYTPILSNTTYPLYGMISYEYGSKLLQGEVQEPLYALFFASLWSCYCKKSNKLSISWKEEHRENIFNFFLSEGEQFEDFLAGKPPKRIFFKQNRTYGTILEWQKKELYCQQVEEVRHSIYLGDVYQLNLSYEVQASLKADPFSLFEELIIQNQAPQSAFLQIDSKNTLLSCSPERLLKRKNNRLYSQPIKGTKPRKEDVDQDMASLQELRSCIKEHSELAMITDLMRNDLYSISNPGSIEVSTPFHIEPYRYVFQQSASISATPRENIEALTALLSLFPGGSITGCPKPRAIERIFEIEKRNRGVYTGSIGYALSKEEYDWNIAIRTLILNSIDTTARFSVGAGIVWDSIPEKEYKETLYKARTFSNLLQLPPVEE